MEWPYYGGDKLARPFFLVHFPMQSIPNSDFVKKEREQLLEWKNASVGCEIAGIEVTKDHVFAADYALCLADRFQSLGKDGKRTARLIARLGLNILGSGNNQRVKSICEWLQWLWDETEDDPLTVSVFSIVDQKQKELERAPQRILHNPADMPVGWNGIDARVIDESTDVKFHTEAGGVIRRTRGAQILGMLPSINAPFLATVHAIGASATLGGSGEIYDQMGASFNTTNVREEFVDADENPAWVRKM